MVGRSTTWFHFRPAHAVLYALLAERDENACREDFSIKEALALALELETPVDRLHAADCADLLSRLRLILEDHQLR